VQAEVLTYTVWEQMLATEMRALYFGELVSRYQKADRLLATVVLVLASSTAGAVIAKLPADLYWLSVLLSLGAASASVWRFVARYADQAANAADLHVQWNRLAADYEKLWNDIYAADAAQKLEGLLARGHELSKPSTRFPKKDRMLNRWYDHVCAQNVAKYGSGA
jgi:hypothetical protein